MTQKFCGDLIVSLEGDTVQAHFPVENTTIPPKQEWSKHAIWQFNGRAYKPLTQLAENNLELMVKAIEKEGYTGATKDGRRKPTSIRYALLTTGVEPFIYIK